MTASPLMVTPDPSDRCRGFVTELILRCARGEEAALGRLYDLFAPLVVAGIGPGDTSTEVEEEAVRAFRRLWLRAPSYDPAAHDAVRWILDQARDVPAAQLVAS